MAHTAAACLLETAVEAPSEGIACKVPTAVPVGHVAWWEMIRNHEYVCYAALPILPTHPFSNGTPLPALHYPTPQPATRPTTLC